jgi:integrase
MAQILKRTTARGEARYDVRTRIGDRVITRTFNRRKHADNYATTLESDKLRGIVIDPRRARTPFKDVATAWVTSSTAKRAGSIARDQGIINNHLLPSLGNRAVGSITKADVQSLVDGWKNKQPPSTIGRQYSCLRALMTWAEASEYIVRTPCRDIRLPRSRLVDRPALDAKQLAVVAEALGPDQATMMWVGTVLGFRWAECAGMTANRIDFGAGTVSVDRQLSRSGTLAPPKSASSTRTLACPKWLMDDLAALVDRRGVGKSLDELVFVTRDDRPLDYTNWRRRIWLPACAKAKQPGLRFHDLRSLATTALVAAGVDVKTAQTRLGHSSPQVTLGIYARTTAENDRNASDLVGEIFRPRDGRAMDAKTSAKRKLGKGV